MKFDLQKRKVLIEALFFFLHYFFEIFKYFGCEAKTDSILPLYYAKPLRQVSL